MQHLSAQYRLLWHLRQPNVVYTADFQELGWPRTDKEFAKFTRSTFGIIFGVIVALSSLSIFALINLSGLLTLEILIGANFVAVIGADIYAVLSTEHFINRQISDGKWDDLHLLGLPILDVIHAKYDIVQLRIRPLIIGTQILRATPYFYLLVVSGLNLIRNGYVNTSDSDSWLWTASLALLFFLPFAVLLVRYEPRWQLNTLAAVGLAIATTIRAPRQAILLGIGALGLLRLTEGVILLAIWSGIDFSSHQDVGAAIESIILLLLILPVVILCLHIFIRILALSYTIRILK